MQSFQSPWGSLGNLRALQGLATEEWAGGGKMGRRGVCRGRTRCAP